jgi:outer membrane lipoprotein-sorting protein
MPGKTLYRSNKHKKELFFLVTVLVVLILMGVGHSQEKQDLWDQIKLSEQSFQSIKSYTCKMHRIELIDDKYKTQKNVLVKYKKPGSFYLKWTEGHGKGSESLYNKDQNGDKMLVHLPGLYKFFVFSMEPDGKRALKNNRHSIDQVHFGFFIEMIKNNLQMANGDPETKISFDGEETLDGVETMGYSGQFPTGKRYYGKRVKVNISKENHLPIRIEVFDENQKLEESYYFTEIILNADLTDADFNPDNPEYGFKKRKVYALD